MSQAARKVKWQTTSVNVNTLLLEASVSDYFWWYLVSKTELSPVSERLPAPHSHRADAAKFLLLVSVMTLAPVWITRPGGWLASLQGASVTTPDSQRTTTADAHTHSYNHTHTTHFPGPRSSTPNPQLALQTLARLCSGRLKAGGRYRQGSSCCCRTNAGTPEITDEPDERSAGQTVHHNLSPNSLNLVLRWRV